MENILRDHLLNETKTMNMPSKELINKVRSIKSIQTL